MKTIIAFSLFLLQLQTPLAIGQTSTVIWQVNSFDINVNVQQEQRLIAVAATLNATNVGNGQGRTLTVRLNSKVSMKSVAVAGAPATFRQGAEAKPDLQKFEISLPSTVAPNGSTSVTVNYTFPVESNSGLAAISPIGTEFLPDSFWFPMPNTPFTIRGADTAPYRISVNLPNAVAGGTEKTGQAGSISFDQSLHGQPFFVQGDWDRIEGSGDNKGVIVLAPKGANAVERKGAETLISFAGAARTFFSTSLGPAPDVPIRLVAVRGGTGFSDGGTLLFDADAQRNALNPHGPDLFPKHGARPFKQKRRHEQIVTPFFDHHPAGQVCWIADSSHLPPRGRTNVQTSVTSCGWSPPSTTRPLARSIVLSTSE